MKPNKMQPGEDKSSLYIGTSGFYYPDWKGCFYPAGMPAREYLPFYSSRFKSLEVNSTFYRLPLESTLLRWRELTPDDFVFAVKASRFITHVKRLDDPEGTVTPFLERIRFLGPKLGPVLFQLPARFPFNGNRLDAFCKVLNKEFRYAFEFRDPGWFRRETCDILMRYGMGFCIYHFAGTLAPDRVTTDFVYIRLHGPLKSPYRGAYSRNALKGWAEKIRRWMKKGKTVYAYFDNTMEGNAVSDAMKLFNMACLDKNHEVLH